MRISDWSSDVCSSDLISSLAAEDAPSSTFFGETIDIIENARPVTIAAIHGGAYGGGTDLSLACDFRVGTPAANMFMRSEEHTSELQSLMRISYAVFCLKKQNNNKTIEKKNTINQTRLQTT